MPPQREYSTWLEIDLGAIQDNVRRMRDLCGTQVMAVVKANGYGHGLLPVAEAALRGGATWCGVARVEEALELRRAGVDAPILVLGATPPGRVSEAIQAGVSLAVWEPAQIEAAASAGAAAGAPARLHLKIDTGMTRLGAEPGRAVALARTMAEIPALRVEGVFTHFARADERSPEPTAQQEERFRGVLRSLEDAGLRPPLAHTANSAAALAHPGTRFDLVRTGIAMYGLQPSADCPLPAGFRPALSWKSHLAQIRITPPGRGVSYGHRYTTRATERIGVIPVGYADGLRRTDGNLVLVGGKPAPVVGRVCMDQCMVRLDGVPDAAVGDEVILIGRQGSASRTAEDLGELWGTINYEVVCGLSARVTRLYYS